MRWPVVVAVALGGAALALAAWLFFGLTAWAALAVPGSLQLLLNRLIDSPDARLQSSPLPLSIATAYFLSAGDYAELLVTPNSGEMLPVALTFSGPPEFGVSKAGV